MALPPYLTLAQAAEMFGVSERTLRRYIAAGLLPASRIGPRSIRVRADDVEALAQPIPTAGGSAVADSTEAEAARLTWRIEDSLSAIADSTEAVIPMIEEARNGNAHTGLDGKAYTRPAPVEPSKPRRRPLPDSYRDAAWKTLKSVESLSRWHQDDRFTSNRDALKYLAPELARAANELCDLLDDLGIDRHEHGGSR